MFTTKYRITLLIAGSMLAFYILTHLFLAPNLIIHSFINVFVGGRSTVKVDLFFGFVILLCFLQIIFHNYKLTIPKIKNSWVITIVTTTFAYNLLLLFIFFKKFGFGIKTFVIAFHNGEVSSTTLLHNHLMKGVNSLLLQPLGLARSENIDTGYAFTGLIATAWLWLGGLLVLLCAILLIIKFLELSKTRELEGKHWQGALIIVYAIISFSLLKNMLDGGLFNRETPVALAGLIYLLFKDWRWSLLPLALFIIGPFISVDLFISYIHLITAFILILITLLYWNEVQRKTRLGILLIILAATFLYNPLAQSYEQYNFQRTVIPTDGAYIALYTDAHKTPESDWKLVETIGQLDIYQFKPNSTEANSQSKTVNDLLVENNLLDNLLPVTVPWQSCMPRSPYIPVTFTVASPQQLQEVTKSYVFANIKTVEDAGKNNIRGSGINGINTLNWYNIAVDINPCAPRVLNVVGELLKERGLEDFFILNISDQNAGA